MHDELFAIVRTIADESVIGRTWTLPDYFDQLAEEVMELHLSMRGKHKDAPAMEWLEIATIAINAMKLLPSTEVFKAWQTWENRHNKDASTQEGETPCNPPL